MSETNKSAGAGIKFLLLSGLGIFVFFINISLPTGPEGAMRSTIFVDHIVNLVRFHAAPAARIYALILMFCGAIIPFVKKTWNKDKLSIFFTFSKCFGAIVGTIIFFNLGREFIDGAWVVNPALHWLWRPDHGPFLYNALAIPVGAVFLAFLTSFGLMEFIGVFLTPVMRPVFKTPGRSAVDAATSFVASYAIAFLVTSEQYVKGKYTFREAAINATGFATVSITFLIVVRNTLGLQEHWTPFFFTVLFVTFATAAITAYLQNA